MSIFASDRCAELLRFCLVGGACVVFNLGLLAFLYEVLGLNYVAAFTIVFVAGGLLGYWLNKRFTFSEQTPMDAGAAVRYLLVNVGAYVVGLALLRVFVEWLHIWYLTATLMVAVVNAPLTFVAQRLITYRLG